MRERPDSSPFLGKDAAPLVTGRIDSLFSVGRWPILLPA
jgi:hypothetical protein